MADGQGRELDAEEAAQSRTHRRKERRRQPHVGEEGADLHGHADEEEDGAGVAQQVQRLAGAGHLGQHQVLDDQSEHQPQHEPADAPALTATSCDPPSTIYPAADAPGSRAETGAPTAAGARYADGRAGVVQG